MKRKFYHYKKWEDYKCGMYDELAEGRDCRISLAQKLLGNPALCEKFMREVVERWTCAAEQVLTNAAINRRAWLGQAACCLYAGCKEDETRKAWWLLTDEEQRTANQIAEKVIADYEAIHSAERVSSGTGKDWPLLRFFR